MSEPATEFKPNLDKLKKLQQQASSIVIGGKGVPRRKKKVIHKTAQNDDKKLQSSLKKLTVNSIQGIDEVNMFKDNGEVLHFLNPKVQASLSSNIFAITGHAETKQLTDMLPSIMQQFGAADNVWNLKNLAKTLANTSDELKAGDDDVPQLVENFDEASKNETTSLPVSAAPVAVSSEQATENTSAPPSQENTQSPAPADAAVSEPVAEAPVAAAASDAAAENAQS